MVEGKWFLLLLCENIFNVLGHILYVAFIIVWMEMDLLLV
jgi:hypothetical protein